MITYKYQKLGSHIRPVISIILKRGTRSVSSDVLVDSGSDSCLFSLEVASALGITVTPEHQHTIGGLSGIQRESYVYPVTIKVGINSYKTKVGFMHNVSGAFNYGIVGQAGFFDHFIVKFNHRKREVALKWNK